MPLDIRGATTLLQVYDMPTALRFYRDQLGFAVVNTSPALGGPDGGEDRFHWVWLRQGEAEVMLNTAYEFDDERPAVADPARVAAHGDTCIYLGCPDIDAAYAELKSRGVNVSAPTIAPYGMKQMHLHDPNGYVICYQCPATT